MMYKLANFIAESNKIEGESTKMAQEVSIYEWFLANDLTEDNTKEFHKRLCDAREQLQKKYRGVYRDCIVYIGGEARSPDLMDKHMKRLFEDMPEPYEFHQRFEHIHPFVDLNGRVGRAAWLHQMLEKQDVPLGFLHTWYYQSLA